MASRISFKGISNLKRKISWKLSNLRNNKIIRKISEFLPPLNFITVHYTYFITTCLLFSILFYLTSAPHYSIGYTDSLFLVVSAMTEAGLNTVNLSQMTTAQQVILWMLIVMGSAIFVSIWTVATRKRVFEQRFEGLVRAAREGRRERRRSWSLGGPGRGRDEDVAIIKRLREERSVNEPVDKHEFESRHSGPKDPTSTHFEKHDSVVAEKLLFDHEIRGGESVAKEKAKGGTESASSDITRKSHIVERGEGLVDEGVHDRMDSISLIRSQLPGPVMQFAPSSPPDHLSHHRVLSFVGVGAHPNSTSFRLPYRIDGMAHRETGQAGKETVTISGDMKDGDLHHKHYPTYLTRHTTGRNAQFYGLSRAEREHLGGVEYRAIRLLAYVVPIYFVLWQLLGCLGLGAYMAYNKAVVAEGNGIDPWWLGIFNGVSAFNNSGMSLLDANMIPFQTSVYTLLTMGLMILAGNTAYPLFLRLILWTILKLLCLVYPSPEAHTSLKSTLRFVLRYPRRVYTNLFPSAPTWWLLAMAIVLNSIDWVAFELLNIGNPAVASIPAHYRVLDGLFQALAVRSGGFYIISITSLRIGLQVLYMIMMYISVYPVVITMRHSNVYEERSLGIYADENASNDDEEQPPKLGTLYGKFKRTLTNIGSSRPFTPGNNDSTPFSNNPDGNANPPALSTSKQFIRQQIRGQLAHDIWWLVLAILFISCIEVSNFERDPVTYSVFNIAFEVVSGYGCVGISTGLPDQAYSFSGGWHKASKLILCAVMLRGRHRGLPVALDRAVRLPDGSEPLGTREEEDWRVRRGRSLSVRRGEM